MDTTTRAPKWPAALATTSGNPANAPADHIHRCLTRAAAGVSSSAGITMASRLLERELSAATSGEAPDERGTSR